MYLENCPQTSSHKASPIDFETQISLRTLASPQTSFGVRLSRIGGEMNAWQTNPKGRLRGGYPHISPSKRAFEKYKPRSLFSEIYGMVKSYVSSMNQVYISYWQNTLQHSQKLEFYRSFKTDHTTSSYLDLIRGTAGRRALVKLWISNHKLMIEMGRYNQTMKDNRHWSFCRSINRTRRFTFFFTVLHTLWLEVTCTIKSRFQILPSYL